MPTPNPADQSSARASAAEFITYLEPLAAGSQREQWHQGLATAREWLRQIDATVLAAEDVSSLIGIAYANAYRGSGWHNMAAGIRRWAEANGYQVPPAQEFFDYQAWLKRTRPPRRWWQFWKRRVVT
jgi:hypothetical protein